jgi:hypothetical protein
MGRWRVRANLGPLLGLWSFWSDFWEAQQGKAKAAAGGEG